MSAWLYNYARSKKGLSSAWVGVQFNNLINYMITRPNPQMTSSKRKESIWILNQRSHSTNMSSIQIDTKQNQIVLLESLHLHLQHSNWYWATSNCPYGVTPFTSSAFKLILNYIKLSCMVIIDTQELVGDLICWSKTSWVSDYIWREPWNHSNSFWHSWNDCRAEEEFVRVQLSTTTSWWR